jgi:hypothetical protein
MALFDKLDYLKNRGELLNKLLSNSKTKQNEQIDLFAQIACHKRTKKDQIKANKFFKRISDKNLWPYLQKILEMMSDKYYKTDKTDKYVKYVIHTYEKFEDILSSDDQKFELQLAAIQKFEPQLKEIQHEHDQAKKGMKMSKSLKEEYEKQLTEIAQYRILLDQCMKACKNPEAIGESEFQKSNLKVHFDEEIEFIGHDE